MLAMWQAKSGEFLLLYLAHGRKRKESELELARGG